VNSETWIVFRRFSIARYPLSHLVVARASGRFATACGRAFDILEAAAIGETHPRYCNACGRRATRSQYLIPTGAELERLLARPIARKEGELNVRTAS
jgi:hypothetical protein